MAKPAAIVEDIPIESLINDPYPAFDRIRDLGSAVWVASANVFLVTGFDDIVAVEQNPKIYASTNPGSLMNEVMGHSLMRKDFDDHKRERAAIEPVFRPGQVKTHMAPYFRTLVDELIDAFVDDGSVDLFPAFAEPLASQALAWMLGLENVAWKDMALWSQALMDGVGNYHGNADVAARAKAASEAVDAAVAEVLATHLDEPNGSVISAMVTAEDPHTEDQVRANVKVIIGGGLNEPRDAVLTMMLGLLRHPEQMAAVRKDLSLTKEAFEETLRWVSPIGMYPRRVTKDTILGDTALKEGSQIGICVGAANRDPSKFTNPHEFNIHRQGNRHIAFGRGPHFCAGAWVARQMVAEISVPRLLERLPNLRLDSKQPVVEQGWVFRGPTSLPVIWDA